MLFLMCFVFLLLFVFLFGLFRGGQEKHCFSKTFLVTTRVAVGAVELYTRGCCRKFQAGADFEVKSTVVTYFCDVFAIFRVGKKHAKNMFAYM